MIEILLSTLLVAAIALALLPPVILAGKRLGRDAAYNTAAGTHPEGVVSLSPEEAVSTKHLLVKRGTAATDFGIADAGELPIGVCPDEADAVDVSSGHPKAVHLLGATRGTILMVAAGVIPDDTDVYSVGGGKVDIVGDAASGDYLVGRSVTAAAADGDEIEVIPEIARTTKG
jgi:hypothetical protein